MSEPYEEIIDGATIVRSPPSAEHELLVDRLHEGVASSMPLNSALRLLPRRTAVEFARGLELRPDIAVIRGNEKRPDGGTAVLYLVGEVLLPGDHHLDTVVKKQIFSDARLPRLWMVDPRYLNVEIYGLGEYGFTLASILAHRETLTDPHLPGLGISMTDLFAGL